MGYLGIVNIDGTSHKIGSTLFGTCSTEAATAAKVVTCSDFTELPTGVTIHVKFTYSNTAANPTLNINSKGAKSIYRYGTTVPGTTAETSWNAGAVVSFTYDGSSFIMNDWVNTNTNTDTNVTQTATNTNANYEVLFSGTADNTTRTEGARKYSNLAFNPSTGTLTTTKVVASTSTLGVADIDTANITEDNVGNLIVTGAARFLNTINGSISGNAATASDSAKLNGYASDTSATNNTIARRTANGYIFATYFNQSSGAETPTSSSYIIYANSDGYFRKSSIANMKTAMSLNNVENKSSATIRGELTSANVTTALGYTPVNKAGDTMSGTLNFTTTNGISYQGTKATYTMISFKDNANDNYGNGIVIGGGGLTVVGGGESASTVAAQYSTGGDEILELTSDGNVYVRTNVQSGYASAKTFTFSTDGSLTATKFIGPLQGNADTATKATQDSDGNVINSTYLKLSGGTLTGSLQIGSSSQSELPSVGLTIHDVRNTTITSTCLSRAVNFFFTNKSTDRPSTEGWSSIMHVQGWNGTENYNSWELLGPAGTGDQRTSPLYVRSSNGSTWGDWRKIYDTSNKPSKSDVGLGNVDNTADANKSVNYATSAGSANTANTATSSTNSNYLITPDGRSTSADIDLSTAGRNSKMFWCLASSSMTTSNPGEGYITTWSWDWGGYGAQLFMPQNPTQSAKRRCSYVNGTSDWGDWITLLDSNNYTSYTVKKDGTGASGTWGISITGNAATATSATKATQDSDGNTINTTYLKKSGGTLTGAINTANNTYNNIGDDVAIGDINVAGTLGVKGLNGATGIQLVPYSGSTAQKISINGSGTMTITGTVASTFSGNLTGNVTGNVSGSSGSCTGNAATATNVAWTGVTSKPILYTGYNITINNTTDWNTITDPGGYKVQMSSWGDADTYHSPNSLISNIYSYGMVFVVGSGVTSEYRLFQYYIPHSTTAPVLVRSHNGSAYTSGWSAWYKLTVGTTKADVGLGNVDNTADANKSVNYAASAGAVAWDNVTSKPGSYPPSSGSFDYIMATRGSSKSTASNGFWAAMCNTNSTGSPTLPTSGKWWHVLSMDWTGNDVNNWYSQLALPTQDGNSLYYRHNSTGASRSGIDNAPWVKVLDEKNYNSYALPLSGGTLSGDLTISHATNNVMTSATTNPQIIFNDSNDNQPVKLVYTDYDSYRGPAGLKVIGGTASASPAWFEVEGSIYNGGSIYTSVAVYANTANSSTAGGLALYGTNVTDYGIAFRSTSNSGKHGYVQTDWAQYHYMLDSGSGRGWVFRNQSTTTNVASINTQGHMVLNGSLTLGGNSTNTSGVRQVYNATTQSLDFIFV